MPAELCAALGDLLAAANKIGLLDRLPGVCAHAPELRELTGELRTEAYRGASGALPAETAGSVDVAAFSETSAHAARVLGVSERRVRQLAETELAGRKFKNRWRFDPDRLAEYQRRKAG